MSATEPFPKAHTYLPCRLDTEDSIHHLQKEASAVLHPAAKTDLSADWRHLRPLAATRSAIWQPKQVKQNSEGGKAWWEANPGGKVVKSEQSGGFVTAITFTGFSSERNGPLKFWTVDSHNTQTGICYSLGSFTTLEEAVAFLEAIKGPSSE